MEKFENQEKGKEVFRIGKHYVLQGPAIVGNLFGSFGFSLGENQFLIVNDVEYTNGGHGPAQTIIQKTFNSLNEAKLVLEDAIAKMAEKEKTEEGEYIKDIENGKILSDGHKFQEAYPIDSEKEKQIEKKDLSDLKKIKFYLKSVPNGGSWPTQGIVRTPDGHYYKLVSDSEKIPQLLKERKDNIEGLESHGWYELMREEDYSKLSVVDGVWAVTHLDYYNEERYESEPELELEECIDAVKRISTGEIYAK
ncbi:MAG TPA: hypothetical protein PKJ75_05080 [Methanosarcina vacuolata]|nr:hypothetical protein [Methanosarcina vacuolata]